MEAPVDILVVTADPADLDRTVGALLGCVAQVVGGPVGPFTRIDGAYVVRCFAGKEFLKMAIDGQGYGRVVRELDQLV